MPKPVELRFVERDGRRILQSRYLRDPNDVLRDTPRDKYEAYTTWEDVPLEAEDDD